MAPHPIHTCLPWISGPIHTVYINSLKPLALMHVDVACATTVCYCVYMCYYCSGYVSGEQADLVVDVWM